MNINVYVCFSYTLAGPCSVPDWAFGHVWRTTGLAILEIYRSPSSFPLGLCSKEAPSEQSSGCLKSLPVAQWLRKIYLKFPISQQLL